MKNWSSFKDYGKVVKEDDDWMITSDKMKLTNNAKFMHCLPVRRNVVVTDEVLDGKNSLVIEQANNISKYSQYLSATINDFRDFFSPSTHKSLVPITKPLIQALNICKATMQESNTSIVKDFQITDKVNLHQNEISQVILSILKNCEDNFLEKNIKNAEIKISTFKNLGKNCITIQDNGGGISKNIIDKIFRPYFSTKIEKNGTGLGLYMSKIIIEKHHNGELHVKNTDKGAMFSIIFK